MSAAGGTTTSNTTRSSSGFSQFRSVAPRISDHSLAGSNIVSDELRSLHFSIFSDDAEAPHPSTASSVISDLTTTTAIMSRVANYSIPISSTPSPLTRPPRAPPSTRILTKYHKNLPPIGTPAFRLRLEKIWAIQRPGTPIPSNTTHSLRLLPSGIVNAKPKYKCIPGQRTPRTCETINRNKAMQLYADQHRGEEIPSEKTHVFRVCDGRAQAFPKPSIKKAGETCDVEELINGYKYGLECEVLLKAHYPEVLEALFNEYEI